MKTILISVATAMTLFAMLAFAAGHPSGDPKQCLTKADVVSHVERSSSGISLTCNEEIRLRNLREQMSR